MCTVHPVTHVAAQPGNAVYANSHTASSGGVTNAADASNVSNTKPNNSSATIRTSLATPNPWIQLAFASMVNVSTAYSVYIRTDDVALNVLDNITIRAYATATGTGSPVTTSSLRQFYLADGTALFAATLSANFQSVRVTLDKPLVGNVEIKVYHAFYGPSSTNATNPYPFSASDCGLPNVTSKQDLVIGLGRFNVTDPQKAIDGDTITNSSFTTNGLALGNSQLKQVFNFNSTGNATDVVRLIISKSGSSLVALDLAGNITIQAYMGDAVAGSSMLASALLGVNLLNLLSDGKKATFYFAPKLNGNAVPFDRVEVSLNTGILGLNLSSNALNIHDIRRVPDAPIASNITACNNAGVVSLVASSAQDALGLTYKWYNYNSGGNSLFTGSTYGVTLPVTGSYTYYVDILKNGCDATSGRKKVDVTVVNAPTTPGVTLGL